MKSIDSNGMLFPREGELFAKVPLNELLSEDTDAGNKTRVLLKIL